MLRPQDVEVGEIDKGLANPVNTEEVKEKAQDTKEATKQNVSGLLANVKQALGFGGSDDDNQAPTDGKTTGAQESRSTKTVESHQQTTGKSHEGKGETQSGSNWNKAAEETLKAKAPAEEVARLKTQVQQKAQETEEVKKRAGDTLLSAQKYEEELERVSARASYARREAENQSALLEDARRRAEEAARAYSDAQKEAQQAGGSKAEAIEEAKRKLKEAEDKKREADMLAKQREALAQKAEEERRLAEEAYQAARQHAAAAAGKEDDLHSLEQQIKGDEDLVESLKRQLQEAQDRLRSRRQTLRVWDVVKTERAEERSARKEGEKHDEKARDVEEGLPQLEDRLNKARASSSEAGKIAKELAERALGLRRIAEEKAALLNRLQAELDEARKKAASLGNVGDNAKAEVGAALAEQEKYKKKVEEEARVANAEAERALRLSKEQDDLTRRAKELEAEAERHWQRAKQLGNAAESEAEQEKKRALESVNKHDVHVQTQHVKKTSEEHEKAAASHVHEKRSGAGGGSSTQETDDRAAYAKHSQKSTTSTGQGDGPAETLGADLYSAVQGETTNTAAPPDQKGQAPDAHAASSMA